MLKLFIAGQTYAMEKFDALRNSEEGQTMAEYGVVLGVITIAAVGAFLALGGRIDDAINAVVALLP